MYQYESIFARLSILRFSEFGFLMTEAEHREFH